MAPFGCALIEIGTLWYAAAVDGRGWQVALGENRTWAASTNRWARGCKQASCAVDHAFYVF
ncbi:MAG: hypothetical protein R2867_15100 [Caldilineaceae bacterium]